MMTDKKGKHKHKHKNKKKNQLRTNAISGIVIANVVMPLSDAASCIDLRKLNVLVGS